jgi:hypothetical protein
MKLWLSMVALLVACAGCPPSTGAKRPYPEPKADDVIAKLEKQRDTRTSFSGESKMDYWLGDQRVKGDVLVMGTSGKKVRFNALSPAGGDVLVDMACGGTNFAYVDKQNNCQLSGPCDRSSIATMLRVDLEPDEFLHLALGTPPIIEHTSATLAPWDGSGQEKLELKGAAGTQTIKIDLREGRLDVVESELKDAAGKTVWSVKNGEFENSPDANQGDHRLPTKTQFKSPQQKADLVVEWGQRTINPQIPDSKFVVTVPDGLPRCGAK